MPKRRTGPSWAEQIGDRQWADFFYLGLSVDQLLNRLHALSFTPVAGGRDLPFNAEVRGYSGARDSEGALWITKPVEPAEAFSYRLGELVYCLDFQLRTLSAPTLLIGEEGAWCRATKVITPAMQISSYDYLQEPFRRVLANDLINRWWTCDEDRNPNNYMVIHTAGDLPLVVAIDFNHADLESEGLKITGNQTEFGWHRVEKTRFLTLLKPSNFEVYGIEDFQERLELMMGIPESRLKELCRRLFEGVVKDPARRAQRVCGTVLERRAYIDKYFRKWFGPRAKLAGKTEGAEYEGLGRAFVEQYKKKI